MSVVEAVKRDLAGFPKPLAASTLAATAESLAIEMDDSENSATAKAMCAKTLTDVMGQLRALAPEKKGAGQLDDLARRRTERLARAAASADSARS